ncbi:hypothetical protein ACH4UR_25040 [Streptomyces lydicus]|uniref:hypothetical protein n=1 Tax=Streptomyces lydicus TaxID=47763 RepID=UPI0033D949E0
MAKALPGVLLDKAELRRVLFPRLVKASPEQNDRLYEFLLQAAVWHLDGSPGAVVVLDGRPLTRLVDVLSLRRFATALGQTLQIIECFRSDDSVVRGVEGGENDCGSSSQQSAHFGERSETIQGPKIMVDTRQPPSQCLDLVLDVLASAEANHPADTKRRSRI